jgi:hypothetical protein
VFDCVGANYVSLTVDQRADHAVLALRLDAGKTADAGTAEESGEDGFRLVIAGVPHSDASGRLLAGKLVERFVTTRTSLTLERSALHSDLDHGGDEGYADRACERPNLLHLVCRLRAETVVDRGGAERQPELVSKTVEDVEQHRRVGASRAGDEDVVAGVE